MMKAEIIDKWATILKKDADDTSYGKNILLQMLEDVAKIEEATPGTYYYQGNPDPVVMDKICEWLHKGIKVYHQYGVPPNPPKDPPH